MQSIELPKPTPDQMEYLERIRASGEDYDRDTIVGGPKEKKMAGAFWVIEAPWQPPHYLQARKLGAGLRDFAWTKEIDKALQFSRQGDADTFLEYMMWGGVETLRSLVTGPGPNPRAVEHSYIEAS